MGPWITWCVVLVAAAIAVASVSATEVFGLNVGQGNAIFAGIALGAAGYLIKLEIEDARTRKAVAMAIAATIRAQYDFVRDSMNDQELDRWKAKQAAIREGTEKPSFGKRPERPHAFLTLEMEKLNKLRPEVVSLLSEWYLRDQDLMLMWDTIGTKELADLGDRRVTLHFNNITRYVECYRDVGYTCLRWLRFDFPHLGIDISSFIKDGAKCISPYPPYVSRAEQGSRPDP
jgi:hypothetical protein